MKKFKIICTPLTCIQKICINNDNGEEEITAVSMQDFDSIKIEFILAENVLQSVVNKSLEFF